MERKGKPIGKLRVRVIVFRDYVADGENAMLTTDFFSLPDEAVEFEKLIKSIEHFGGGDEPEDGLEAIAYAIKSDWTKDGDKRRHIIVVWTDDGTHTLGFGAKVPNYPKRMARDFDELTDWWGDADQPGLMNNEAKRLVLFAPEKKYWSTICDSWNLVTHYCSQAGNGLGEVDYSAILNEIINSI